MVTRIFYSAVSGNVLYELPDDTYKTYKTIVQHIFDREYSKNIHTHFQIMVKYTSELIFDRDNMYTNLYEEALNKDFLKMGLEFDIVMWSSNTKINNKTFSDQINADISVDDFFKIIPWYLRYSINFIDSFIQNSTQNLNLLYSCIDPYNKILYNLTFLYNIYKHNNKINDFPDLNNTHFNFSNEKKHCEIISELVYTIINLLQNSDDLDLHYKEFLICLKDKIYNHYGEIDLKIIYKIININKYIDTAHKKYLLFEDLNINKLECMKARNFLPNITSDITIQTHLYQELIQDLDINKLSLKNILHILFHNNSFYELVPEHFKYNKDVLTMIFDNIKEELYFIDIARCGYYLEVKRLKINENNLKKEFLKAYNYYPTSNKNILIKDFLYEIIFSLINADKLSLEEIVFILKKNGIFYKKIPYALKKNKELIKIALHSNGRVIKDVDKKFLDKESIIIAVSNYGLALLNIVDTKYIHDIDIINFAIRNNGDCIKVVPPNLINKELVFQALASNPRCFIKLPIEWQNDEDVIIRAVKRYRPNIKFINDAHKAIYNEISNSITIAYVDYKKNLFLLNNPLFSEQRLKHRFLNNNTLFQKYYAKY